jgi:branched-chain amino acid transport system substrate-binding protein
MKRLAAAAAAIAAVVATATATATTHAKKPIVIGFAIARTGGIAPYDDPPQKMAQIAIDDLNAHGGVMGYPLKAVFADTKSQISLGTQAADEVIAKGASVVVVTCDYDYGGAAAREAQAKGKLAFSTCAASPKFGVQGIGPLAFTMATGTPDQGAIDAEWSYDVEKWRSAYVLLDDTVEYDRTLCSYFEQRWRELGGTIAGKDVFKQTDPSVATQISRLRSLSKQPDFVFFCSYTPGGASALKQIRAAGVDAPILTSESMDGSYWLSAVPNLSNFYNTTYASVFGDDPNPRVNALVERYARRYGAPPPTAHALTGYSVIEAIAKAIQIASKRSGVVTLDGSRLAKALETFRNVQLLVGATTFTPTLHLNLSRPMAVLQVTNGKHEFLQDYRAKSVPKPKF